jgi:hypothetical protein
VKFTSSREAVLGWSPELAMAIALHRVFGRLEKSAPKSFNGYIIQQN